MKWIVYALSVLALTACTSIKVKPVEASTGMKNVCIRENPAVEVDDFLTVMQDGFRRHGVASQVYTSDPPPSCDFVATYTALRSWDFKTYLSHAEIQISEHGILVASAVYHLNFKGGDDFGKFRGTKAKIDPVMDQLLANFHQ